jgi:3-deoxy-D-manno-octulosonic-acid transferase
VWFQVDTTEMLNAALRLAERLRASRDWISVLITASWDNPVPASLPEGVLYCATPSEARQSIDRFLDHWSPDICVWCEGYFRPGLLAELTQRNVPHVLINGRGAALDTRRWRWFPALSKALLQGFDRLLAVDETAAQRVRKLGAPPWRIELSGTLDEGGGALRYDEDERASWVEDLAGRPLWLAAHVASQEERSVLLAHRQARKFSHRILLVLVPQDPTQVADLERTALEDGWSVAVRSRNEPVTEATDIYVADHPCEMGLWFRLAPLSFLGGTLAKDCDTANPTEPAALGSAIIHGFHVQAHQETYKALEEAGGALLVRNADELAKAIGRLLSPDQTARMAHAAWDVCTQTASVTERVLDMIFTALDDAEAT